MRLLSLLCALLVLGNNLAMATSVPSGKMVPLQLTQTVDTDQNKKQESVTFKTTMPIKDDTGAIVVPAGSLVDAKIMKNKNNMIFGIPASMTIGQFNLRHNQELVPLSCSLTIEADNRSALSLGVGLLLIWPFLFAKGNDVKLDETQTVNCMTY